MRRSILRALVALVLLAALAGATLVLSTLLSPERLRALAEGQLAEMTGHPVSVARVEVALGVGIQLRGEDLELWPGPDGPALRVAQIGVGLDPLSLLTGNLRPRRIRLEGAELRIAQAGDGRFGEPFGRDDPEPESPDPREPLAPWIAVEGFFRFLLARPYLADTVEARASRVILELPRTAPGKPPRVFSLAIAEGQLAHRRLRGDALLELRGGLYDRTGPLGALELRGRRDTAGELELDVGFRGLELAAAEKYVPDIRPGAGLEGDARGRIAFRSEEPGRGELEVDLELRDLEARLLQETPLGPFQAPQLSVAGRLLVSPDRLDLEDVRVRGGALGLELRGGIGRPFAPASPAQLELGFHGLDMAELHALLDWLPYAPAEQLEALVEPVVAGRLQSFTARGSARVSDWQDLFAGRTAGAPLGLGAEAELADLAVQVGEDERIEQISGRVEWSDDRLRVSDLRGTLRGEPLPVMDLDFEGLSHLVAAEPERRQLRAGALPLPGVDALWKLLSGDGDRDDEEHRPLAVDLEVDWLHHPVCLWPLEQLRARVRTRPDGLRVDLDAGTWGGVPIRGRADWRFEPERRVSVALGASAPEPGEGAGARGRNWARGRLLVGPIHSPVFRQLGAEGRFDATAGTLRLHDLDIDLDPAGRLRGTASLDLSEVGAVPLQLSLALSGGDVDGLLGWFAPERDIASGRVDAWGTFGGRLVPGTSVFSDLTGFVEMEASEGRIQRALPPIVAIALASRSFNPFVERDSIRYHRVRSVAEIDQGRVSSRELSIEGPDMRVVASGAVDLLGEAHHTEAEVALFLFRPLDKAVGTIPVLNVLLLGKDQNLMAAYFRLDGPWEDPDPVLVPLKSLAAGPGSLVMEGVPGVVLRGVRALGSVLEGKPKAAERPERPERAPWQETPRDS